MTPDRYTARGLEDAIEKATQEFAHGKMHRYAVYDGNSMCRAATLEDVDFGGRYAGYPTVFSRFQ